MEAAEKEVKSASKEIDDLYKKYESLSKKVEMIEKENRNTENSMKRIEDSVGTMNTNFDTLMKKLDSIMEDKEAGRMFQKDMGKNISFNNMIKRPMRKLAVGTMSTVFQISSYASEKLSGAREGMEDIVAEAQYKSKKRMGNMSDMGMATGAQ